MSEYRQSQREGQAWQSYVPTDVLHLESSPYIATITIADRGEHVGYAGEHGEQIPNVAPLRPITIAIQTTAPPTTAHTATFRLYDSDLRPSGVYTAELRNGKAHVAVLPRGVVGEQAAVVTLNGKRAGVHNNLFVLNPYTEIATGQPDLDLIYPTVLRFMQQDVVSYELNGETIRGYRSPDNPLIWLRDHVYQGRGFRYFETDMTSVLEAFREAQQPNGSFPDVLDYPALGVHAHRLEPESDLEYLFVQGVYDAWQATCDDDWMLQHMDAMRQGIGYITSDPQRWDEELQLVRRPYTIDTWDFQYGPTTTSPDGSPAPRHWIDDQTVWGIFHGDNTGLAYALRLLQRIEQYLGNDEPSRTLHTQRDALVDRLNLLSWRGPFFTHFVLPDGTLPQVDGVDTSNQLSLSNALALNREILSFEQGRLIVETYHKRRNFDKAFAEWYSIDPPFPVGAFGMAGGKGERPGEYVNGGIMPLVGGELARGAFTYGAEEYGFDILRRYAELIRLTGASYLWYYPDGRPGISGKHTLATDGWGASAMLGALVEGAAGVVDKSTCYRSLSLDPRWGALPEMRDARVVVRYPASEGYVAYTWEYTPEAQQVRLDMTGSWQDAHIRLLLPSDGRDTESRTLLVDGVPTPFSKKKIGGGQYIIFDVAGGNAEAVLSWVK